MRYAGNEHPIASHEVPVKRGIVIGFAAGSVILAGAAAPALLIGTSTTSGTGGFEAPSSGPYRGSEPPGINKLPTFEPSMVKSSRSRSACIPASTHPPTYDGSSPNEERSASSTTSSRPWPE